MVAEQKPDVVHNCLPHYLHFPVTKDLVEIGVCLQNRMNETTEELKKIIDSGEYGKIIGIRGFVPWRRGPEYYSVKPWRGTWKYAGGVSMINQSLHTLDLLCFLIEQDDSYVRDSFDRLNDSRAHLVELGYESWF